MTITKYKVNITSSAEDDIFAIYRFIFVNDSPEKAEKLYSKLYEDCLSLQDSPFRGHIPKELSFLGMSDFLEISLKPYRVIYKVIGNEVFIHCILDGRRDMQTLLHERLIRG